MLIEEAFGFLKEEEATSPKGPEPEFVRRTRLRIAKMRAGMMAKLRRQERGEPEPLDENASMVEMELEMIPLTSIVDDGFKNCRLSADDDFEGGRLEDLTESMRSGQVVPINVIAADKDTYLLRAGFRRVEAARRLDWTHIAAMILPNSLPEIEQCWLNIVENSSRKNLTPYEVAMSAKRMRDEYKISGPEYARRVGLSQSYIRNLLSLVDRLPPEVIDYWRRNNRPTISRLMTMLHLEPADAIRELRAIEGLTPKEFLKQLPKGQKRSKKPGSAASLDKMQRLFNAIQLNSKINLKEKWRYLQIVEFCMDGRDRIPGLYDASQNRRRRKIEAQEAYDRDVKLPDPNGPDGPDELEIEPLTLDDRTVDSTE